jgi:precorrin-2 dehydrogenase/sirohydrochlorin ferrochelatase/precorrin-6A/cobalt-precorrin-6A reductase
MKFPLFIDITDKKVLVVGAGKIGLRRVNTLLDFGAEVVLVSDKINSAVDDNVRLFVRQFEDADIDGAFLVVAATNDRLVNHRIYELCSAKNIPVSVADSAEESTFFFPAICKNESLCIGVVSDGEHHDLVRKTASRIRGELL